MENSFITNIRHCINITQSNVDSDYDAKPSFTQILVISSIGLIFFIALRYHLKKIRDQKIIPRLRLSRAGHPPKLERFSHYVGIQKNMYSIQLHTLMDPLLFYHLEIGMNLYVIFFDLLQLGKWGSRIGESVLIYVDWLLNT